MNTVESLLSWEKVLDLIPLSKRDIQRRIAANLFPRPCRIGRRTVFPESEISTYIERIKKESRQ